MATILEEEFVNDPNILLMGGAEGCVCGGGGLKIKISFFFKIKSNIYFFPFSDKKKYHAGGEAPLSVQGARVEKAVEDPWAWQPAPKEAGMKGPLLTRPMVAEGVNCAPKLYSVL